MHEFSLCQQLLRQLEQLLADDEQATDATNTTITSITLKLGPYAGIDRDGLMRSFPLAASNSRAANATLVIENMPLTISCKQCQTIYQSQPDKLSCPSCGSKSISVQSGDEILISSIQTSSEACS